MGRKEVGGIKMNKDCFDDVLIPVLDTPVKHTKQQTTREQVTLLVVKDMREETGTYLGEVFVFDRILLGLETHASDWPILI